MSENLPRRWFAFRLRTLLAVVAVAAIVGREGRIVFQRKAALRYCHLARAAHPIEASWPRRLLGDETFSQLRMQDDAPLDAFFHVKRLYPEARVEYICGHPLKSHPAYQRAMTAVAP